MTVSLNERTCPVCGGKFILSVNSQVAVCENCGKTAEVDAEALATVRKSYRSAEQKIHRNTAADYSEAINLLQGISFVKEAQEQTELCSKRLGEIKDEQERREESKKQSDKNDSIIGYIFLILFLLVVALAVAGAVYIIYHLKMGDLSPTAIAIIASAIGVFTVSLIIGKIKS
jgi:uncharacterized protein YqhQ